MTTDERRIAIGGHMKAAPEAGEGIVEGYAVAFTSPDERDLHGQYFSKATNFHRDVDEIVGTPILYHHGLDPRIKRRTLGYVTKASIDDRGVWIQAQLDMHKDYVQDVYELAKKDVLAWSSGANPAEVSVSAEDHIDDWGFIEFSETPTPAEPNKTVISAKAYASLLKDGTGHEEQDGETRGDTTKATVVSDEIHPQTRRSAMDRLKELLAEIAALFAGDTPMDAIEETEVLDAMRAEAGMLPDDEKKALESDDETAAKSIAIDKLMAIAAKTRHDRKAKRLEPLKSRFDHLKQNAPAPSVTDTHGVPTQARVTGMQDLKYDGLTASDMLLGLQVSMAASKSSGFTNVDPRMVGISEGYLRAMYAKAQANADNPHHDAEYSSALKTAFPRALKANELDASNIVTQGFEWVSQYWGATVWETPRAPTMYDELVSRGLGSQVVPQGAQTVYIPTEGSDPIVYSTPEANSVDVTGRPEVTVPITPFGTGRVALTPGELKLATSYTVILGEDSIVPIVRQLNMQIDKKMKQTRDQVLLNGDTATGASVNINLIDSTPATGIRRPYYLNSDGFRKLPLVTNTAMSRDGGVLSLADFAATLALFPYAQRTILRNMAFIIDGNAQMWALDFPQWLTPQVAGGRGFGTLENGVLTAAYGAPIITSGYIPLTGAAGKEYGLPANLALNVKSTLLAVDLSQWMVGYKREMTIETARDILSGSEIIVASMRMGVVSRSTTASAVSYNLTQV